MFQGTNSTTRSGPIARIMSLAPLRLETKRRKQLACLWLALAATAFCLVTVTQAYPTAADLGLFASSDLSSNKLDPGAGLPLVPEAELQQAAAAAAAGSIGGSPLNGGAKQSADFHEFISSGKPDSTIIGELKPNASAEEMAELRNNIAKAISKMQALDRQEQRLRQSQALLSGGAGGGGANAAGSPMPALLGSMLRATPASASSTSTSSGHSSSSKPAEQTGCYIEVPRVEKVLGKCQRAANGQPICQSDTYMTISSQCN